MAANVGAQVGGGDAVVAKGQEVHREEVAEQYGGELVEAGVDVSVWVAYAGGEVTERVASADDEGGQQPCVMVHPGDRGDEHHGDERPGVSEDGAGGCNRA